MPQTQDRLEWAIKLARHGFHVFPLPTGSKEPKVRWKDVMTRDESQITEWLGGTDANYGICPGNSYAVVDLDVKGEKNGVEAFGLLTLEHGLAETLSVRTPSGGIHHYFTVASPVGNAHEFPEGIDVRGEGGYVVGPGCTIGDSSYEVIEDMPISPAPGWVASRFKTGISRAENNTEAMFELDLDVAVDRARALLEKRAPAIEGRNGNDHTYATATLVKDFGISEDKCLEILLERDGWNARCAPPWDALELSGVVHNAYQYGRRQPGAKGGGVMEMYDGEECEEPPQQDLKSKFAEHEFTLSEFVTREKRRETVIPGWLPAHGFTALLAKYSGGKTVTLMDMACRIANDMDWHGMPVREGFHCIYLCGEDDVGAQVMAEAWRLRHNVTEDNGRFLAYDIITDLMSAENTKEWAEYLYERIGVADGGRAAVFLDTWQRATSRGAQNSDEDMQLAVHHAEALARSLNGPLIGAFHPPKADQTTILGSSVIENDTVAIWHLGEHAVGRKLEVSRIKGSASGSYALFDFEQVDLCRLDEHGQEETGIVVRKVGGLDDPATDNRSERKGAYAEVLKQLEINRKSEDPNSKFYSVSAAANRIEKLGRDAKEGDEWSTRLAGILEFAGIKALSRNPVKADLRLLFKDDPRGYDFDDGHKLVLRVKGNNSEFKIIRNAPSD